MAVSEFLIADLLDDATLSHSSEESSLPAENTQNVLPTKRWRSDSGWNFAVGVNDKIDITEGVTGDAIATLTPGNYSTGALVAVMVAVRINVAATDNTWTCTYNAGTRKFTIGHDNVQTGGLEWATGASTATSAGKDLGYDTSADDVGGVAYVGDYACRCSREWIGIDLGAATLCTRSVVVSHNFSSSAVVTLYRHNADDLSAATLVGTFVFDADFMVLEFSATWRYWWIHVHDIDNSDGYIEFGRAFLGVLSQPTEAPSVYDYALIPVDQSPIAVTPEGAVGKNIREMFHRVTFQFAYEEEADRDALLAIYRSIGAHTHFFFRPDPGETQHHEAKLGGMYGYFLDREPRFGFTAPNLWTVKFNFEEAR